jgi:hypothetical protein
VLPGSSTGLCVLIKYACLLNVWSLAGNSRGWVGDGGGGESTV